MHPHETPMTHVLAEHVALFNNNNTKVSKRKNAKHLTNALVSSSSSRDFCK